MALALGTRLGVYEIAALIGEGGMGQVYRATDTTLGRQVAIKVLPDAFAADPERLARFEREAKTLASLNHPHVAAIYGFEKSDGLHALVMELVEGDDLSQRIARGAIPLDEALPIAKQIADALEAAHEQGIVHRDLKPANIKARVDGTVKVLDFGLAKAMEPLAGSSPDATESPMITSPAITKAGMILGTAAYMAPEQARGKAVDKRADIWAFGCVLFEMVSGRPPFAGETVTETLAEVMKSDPPWPMLPASVPANLHGLLRRCLVKDPRQRIRDMGDVRLALDGAVEMAAPPTPAAAAARRRRRARLTALALALVAGIVAIGVATMRYLRDTPTTASPGTRVDIVTLATSDPISFALSPDGRQVVYAASGDGPSRLWLRSLATTTAQPLTGTEEATYPFWSPDSRSVGFFAAGALKRIDLGSGAPQTLATVTTAYGGTWSADGVILFAPSLGSPFMRVSATGGAAVAVPALGPPRTSHFSPYFLPDGQRFLFTVLGGPDTNGIYLGALDGRAATRLTSELSLGVFLRSAPRRGEASRGGWLLGVRSGAPLAPGTLVAQQLDVEKAKLTGDPVTVADGVVNSSVSATGLVAYRTGGASERQLVWVDRSGTARGTVGDADETLIQPRVSPDGGRVAMNRTVDGNSDIWLSDGTRTSRLTFDATREAWPVWSPDGARIAFQSTRAGHFDLYQMLTSGAGDAERLVTSDQQKAPNSWSPDGRFLLYHSTDPQTNSDLWVVPTVGDHTPSVFLKTPFREAYGAFSPDGRWVAYHSNESGRTEVYVRPFVPPGVTGAAAASAKQWQVSTAGGVFPVWRHDGGELYYINPAGAMMAAPIVVTGATLAAGAPVALFRTHIFGGGVETPRGPQYDVAPDGRFLINTVLETNTSLTLLMNWNPQAQK